MSLLKEMIKMDVEQAESHRLFSLFQLIKDAYVIGEIPIERGNKPLMQSKRIKRINKQLYELKLAIIKAIQESEFSCACSICSPRETQSVSESYQLKMERETIQLKPNQCWDCNKKFNMEFKDIFCDKHKENNDLIDKSL